MTDFQILVAHAAKLALLALIAGIAWRGRARLCWSFAVYALAIFLGNVLVTLWPARFFTPSFWVLKQGAYDILKMAVALELAWRVFETFPGARRTARLALLALLTVSTITLAVLTPPPTYFYLWEWQSGIATAALWLLTATALLVVWYQVPVHEWQRAIMLGLVPYLLVVVTTLDLLRRHGWDPLRVTVGLLDSAAYLAVLLFWNGIAWRREPAPATPAGGRA